MPVGGSHRARLAALADDDQEITSTYRAMHGGPAGLRVDSWTYRGSASVSSASTPALSRQQSESTSNFESGGVPGRTGSMEMTSPYSEAPLNEAAMTPSAAQSAATLRQSTETVNSLGDRLGRVNLENGYTRYDYGPAPTSSYGGVPSPAAAYSGGSAASRSQYLPGGSSSKAQSAVASPASPTYSGTRQSVSVSTSGYSNPTSPSSSGLRISPPSNPAPPTSVELSPTRMPYLNNNSPRLDGETVAAANRVTALVSKMTTGSAREQLDAAKSLREALEKHGAPVKRAVHMAGGTHMLLTLLRSGRPELQEVCAEALADLCSHTQAMQELTAIQDTVTPIVSRSLKGVASGNAAYTKLFVALATSNSDSVKAACANHKAVRFLADILSGLSSPAPTMEARAAAVSSLEALCKADPGANIKKLAWGEGLSALVPLLQPPSGPAAESAMNLLTLALKQDPLNALSLCSPVLIEALSELIADPDVSMVMQVGAAKVLVSIAALESRKEEATEALNECALPRACEILHQSGDEWRDGAPSTNGHLDLQAACAALIGHLSLGSPLCCHVIMFHAEALHTLVSVLTGCHEFTLVEAVLGAYGKYAAAPTAMI